ncbi:MAG: DUF1552 domain-containing protein [Myxococcales bacterium]|nr:DUF1552 domain-containing protein [Myxococcales bacterium]
MTRRAIERRKFLRAIGATALTYPFLRSLPTFAQSSAPPSYLILVFTPCGVVRYLWGAQCPTRSAAVVTSTLTGASGAGAFRQTLMPLATGPTLSNLRGALSSVNDLTNQVILIDGLNVATADGTHEAGMAALWTAQYSSGDSAAGKGMSIDQAIAAQLPARPFSSIQLMVRDPADFTERSVKTRMIYNATDFVDPMDDPAFARSTVFQTSAADAGTSAARSAAIRAAIFAQLNRELTGIQSKLCTEDRVRLQDVQGAWQSLDAQLASAKTAAAKCTPPAPLSGKLDFPAAAKAQMDLAALALACNMTRVLSIQFSTATSNVAHTWINASDSQTHHQHSHTGPSYLGALGPDFYNPATYNPPGAGVTAQPLYDAQLAQIDLWYANQVAYLAQSLNNLNLLGQSVICWGSELDQGQPHNHDSTPFVLIGGGGGKLDTGKFVQFPLNLAYGSGNNDPTGNRFHNDLLITLAQVMGVPMSSFGTTTHITSKSSGKALTLSTGPITQILKGM